MPRATHETVPLGGAMPLPAVWFYTGIALQVNRNVYKFAIIFRKIRTGEQLREGEKQPIAPELLDAGSATRPVPAP